MSGIGTTFKDFIGSGSTGIIGIINTIIVPTLIAAAFLVFIWGVVKYFFLRPSGVSSFAERGGYEEGRHFIFWGILGMVLIFSLWGLVNMLLSTLGFV